MTAPRLEQFANNPVTTLNGGINDSVTTVTVTDGSVFPSVGNFRVVVEDEVMLATARAGNDLTVARGQEGTTAASHLDTTQIALSLTSDSLDAIKNENMWNSGPPYHKIVSDDGVTLLTASDFTWVNQGSATAADQNGTILATVPMASGLNNRVLTRSAPSTPYVYISAMQLLGPIGDGGGACWCFMGFRESSSGELALLEFGRIVTEIYVGYWNSPTSFNTQARAVTALSLIGGVVWMRIGDNGTNLTWSVGMDGENFIDIFSASRTALMAGGPDQILWGGSNHNSSGNTSLVRLLHWSRVS